MLDAVGDDVKLAYHVNKQILSDIRAANMKPRSEEDILRYIRQEELNWICYYLLQGSEYDVALEQATEAVQGSLEEIHEACGTVHKIEYLNNMLDRATRENQAEFRKLRETKYLKQSDYKGKTRPRTGLKNIERAVQHKAHHESLQAQVDTLTAQLQKTDAGLTLKNVEVADIQKHLGIELTTEQKVSILLTNGYNTDVICESVGCSKSTVSRVRNKMRKVK